MNIIDQKKFSNDNSAFVSEEHRAMISSFLSDLEKIQVISPIGLTVLQSAGYDVLYEMPELSSIIDSDLIDYDFLIDDKEYKLENVSFI